MKVWAIFTVTFFLGISCVACVDGALNIAILFDNVDGLKRGDPVIWQGNEIGAVKNIGYLDTGKFKVEADIKGDFKKAVLENSEFYVSSHPSVADQKIIEMIIIGTGGKPVKNGTVFQGSTRISALIKKERVGLDGWINDLSARLEKILDDIEKLRKDEEYQKLKTELDQLAKDLEESGEKMSDRLENEVLPKLKEEIQKLKERLGEPEKEEIVKPIQELHSGS